MSTRLVALALVAAAIAAGCIQPSDPAVADSPPPATHNEGGAMSATTQTKNETCSGNGGAACAARRVLVSGSMGEIQKMDLDLRTFNGHLSVKPGAAGSWSMTAVLKAYGSSQEDAQAQLEHVLLHWRHTDGASHFVQAEVRKESNDCCRNAEGSLDVVLPADVTLVVTMSTTNGAVSVKARTDGLSVDTVNGQIQVDADVTQVALKSVNGQIQASLRPTASGRISAQTTNGQVALTLPEDARRGYDLDAKTTNGVVNIQLREGDVGPCPTGSQYYTPPCNHRTFKTRDYDGRAIQSQVALEAVNGQLVAKPS